MTGVQTCALPISSGEADVHDVREVLSQQTGYGGSQFGGIEPALVFQHVVSIHEGRQRGSVGAGSSDTLFLQLFDQRRLSESGRGLCEVLLRYQLQAIHLISLFQMGQHRAYFFVAVNRRIVPVFHVQNAETGEFKD